MQNRATTSRDFKFYAYVLVSFLLAIPVLLWPLSWVAGLEPSFGTNVAENWLISATVMLLAVTVADSIFSGVASVRQALDHTAWVVVTAAVIPTVLHASNSAYLLGAMFFIHSLRSFFSLWHWVDQWWLWPAWIRDSSMAMLLLLWITLSP
ncbi:MAG: hypothetical protein R8K54_01915 [Mariprofundaceae bacterium]